MANCYNNTAVLGCYNNGVTPPVTVYVKEVIDNQGQPQIRITDILDNLISGADATNVTLGACAVSPADVEFEVLCDIQPDGSSTPFARRKITTFDAYGVPTVEVADFEMDYVTPFFPTASVGVCPTCPELPARGLQNV